MSLELFSLFSTSWQSCCAAWTMLCFPSSGDNSFTVGLQDITDAHIETYKKQLVNTWLNCSETNKQFTQHRPQFTAMVSYEARTMNKKGHYSHIIRSNILWSDETKAVTCEGKAAPPLTGSVPSATIKYECFPAAAVRQSAGEVSRTAPSTAKIPPPQESKI